MSDQEKRIQEIRERQEAAQGFLLKCDRTNHGCHIPQAVKLIDDDIPYLLESLQRERQEPEPLEALELDDFVAKPVFCVDSKSKTREWRIIESAYIDYSDYDCSYFVLSSGSRETEITGMDITSGVVKLYATEPKGEHHD